MLLMLSIFIIHVTNVEAKSTYDIKIPTSFKKDKNKDYWQKTINNETINILVHTDKNKDLLDLSNIDNNDINNERYLKQLKTTFKQLGYNIDSYSTKLSKTNINNYPAIVMDVSSKYTLESNTENTVYQRQYILTSKNYVYYIICSSSNRKYLDNEEMFNILKTFKINDKLIDNKKEIIKYYVTLTCIIGLGVVITIIFSKKK